MAATHPPSVRRAKLRRPQLPSGLVSRRRLTTRLDQSLEAPLTLVAAPAGFGKTTLLTEWAVDQPHPLAWLTLDAGNRDLRHFVGDSLAAIESLVPGICAPVFEVLQRPGSAPAAELGGALADALLDLPLHVVFVMDDFQAAASGDVERFLGAVLQSPAPLLHLILATRSDPTLPLARMRLRGHVVEVRAADLRFRDEEARELLVAMGYGDGDPALVAALQEQTGGWIGGLRLATLARPSVAALARLGDGEHHLMEFLVDEVLSSLSPATQDFLLRTAIVERIATPLADALSAEPPPGGSQALLHQLVHDCLFLAVADEGEWYHHHPLFHTLLRRQLRLRLSPDEIAALHLRASAWFAAHGQLDQAIRHRVAAGDPAGAATLVEHHAQTALAREDWNALDGWLRLLPEAIVDSRPDLLLAKGWVSHFSGRSVPITAMMATLNALLTASDASPAEIAAWEAERDVLAMTAHLWINEDPDRVLVAAQRAAACIPAERRLATGQASFWIGMALQATGRTDDAVRWLTAEVERGEGRVDVGTIRPLGALMFVHARAGNVTACEEAARYRVALAQRYDLPVVGGWGHWKLGWNAYERNELTTAVEHFSEITADYRRVHFHTACEAMFGLALVAQAQGKPAEAAGTLRRLLEFVFDINALEYLPLVRAFDARLALRQGAPERAIAWMETEPGVSFASSGLGSYDQPYLTRIRVLLAEGSTASLERAWQDVVAFQEHSTAQRHHAHDIEILALKALVLAARDEVAAGLASLSRALELAATAGFVRTFVDLGPAVTSLLRRLVAEGTTSPFLWRLLREIDPGGAAETPAAGLAMESEQETAVLTLLTEREAEVLACLARRLSYQEIGAELFISPLTVKTHAANIYGKLGVRNRRQALAAMQSLGRPPRT